jgi:small multidrug resistance family-3 protein
MRLGFFIISALLELTGCYLVWSGFKQGGWGLIAAGFVVLAAFGLVLAQAGDNLPSRAYAAYGGIYIAATLAWMVVVDKHTPDRWDMAGVAISLAGALVVLFGPRG